MLQRLCGNKNIQRILIFLFVNGRCYGTQIPPIQKALGRLEKGGIITSYSQGKTKLYQFNLSYPLIGELEHLIKKAYTLMPAHEKKNYYVLKEGAQTSSTNPKQTIQVLLSFWDQLQKVSQLTFKAKTKSKEENGWNGRGAGEVIVTKEGGNILIFQEKGTWQGKQGSELTFSNVFRLIALPR